MNDPNDAADPQMADSEMTGEGNALKRPDESVTETIIESQIGDVSNGESANADGSEPSDVQTAADLGVTADADADDHATSSSAPQPPPPAPPKAPPSKPAVETEVDNDSVPLDWYILKVAFNREDTIADALRKRVAMEGMEEHITDIVVPTEDVVNFTRDGKRRISKQKLFAGYIMVRMRITDDTWFLVRETGGISDFTGASGKPMPMDPDEVERIIHKPVEDDEEEEPQIKIGIPFKVGDQVRVKEGNFENQEGLVDTVDETNGNITVIITIFNRSVPVELKHFEVEPL